MRIVAHFALACSLLGTLACQSTPAEPEATRPRATVGAASWKSAPPLFTAQGVASGANPPSPSATAVPAVAAVPISPDDPLGGKFDLARALEGLPREGTLTAVLDTEKGTLTCELFEDKAPITVANFVGLARGLRPFKTPEGRWEKRKGYDGTTFHRIVKGFMIQGGDPRGTGAGEPGYVIPDEVWPGAKHDRRGQLCMANRGKNTNGMQFFITDGPAPHLDGGYTIFGQCSGEGTEKALDALVASEVRGERAVNPPKIRKVTIERRRPKR